MVLKLVQRASSWNKYLLLHFSRNFMQYLRLFLLLYFMSFINKFYEKPCVHSWLRLLSFLLFVLSNFTLLPNRFPRQCRYIWSTGLLQMISFFKIKGYQFNIYITPFWIFFTRYLIFKIAQKKFQLSDFIRLLTSGNI